MNATITTAQHPKGEQFTISYDYSPSRTSALTALLDFAGYDVVVQTGQAHGHGRKITVVMFWLGIPRKFEPINLSF